MLDRYRRVWVVYRKELIDTLRDRRTLMAMILVPIVLYPVLMVVLVEALRTETVRRQAEHYTICVPDEAHKAWLLAMLTREDEDRRAYFETLRQTAEKLGEEWNDEMSGFVAFLTADQVTIDVLPPGETVWDDVAAQKHQVGVIVEPPPDAADLADATNRIVQVTYCDTDPRSEHVYSQLARIVSNEAERIVHERVASLPQGDAVLRPLLMNSVSTADPDKQYAKILAMIVPFLLVTMTVTGAMYPAIDLTAGERERGTLETLAVSPVPVGQIVAGKFGVIVTIAMISTGLNLGSMTAMVYFSKLDKLVESAKPALRAESLQVEAMIQGKAASPLSSEPTSVSAPAVPADRDVFSTQRANLERRAELEAQARLQTGYMFSAAPIVLAAMIPFAILFGGVMLAACSFARTFKEAQNYMMPVMMAAIVPAMVVSYMPTIKLEGIMLVIPVANVVVLMRELLIGNFDLPAVSACLLSTCLYAVAAVALAAKVYGHEAVLFSDVGSYKTLLRRRFMRPQARPSAAIALLTVAVIFPLNFYWQSYFAGTSPSSERLMYVIAGAQVFILAVPVVLLGWYVRLDLRKTFSLAVPRLSHAGATLLLAVSIVPVSFCLQQALSRWFGLGGGDSLLEHQMLLMTGGSVIGMLLAFAVTPGVCEEVLFRGFLQSGLREKFGTLRLVLVVGLVFGVYHVQFEKVPTIALMGALLSLVCLRSGSIYLAMFLHIVNNGLGLLIAREVEGAAVRAFYHLPQTEEALAAWRFDAYTGAFLCVFLLGLAVFIFSRNRESPRASRLA